MYTKDVAGFYNKKVIYAEFNMQCYIKLSHAVTYSDVHHFADDANLMANEQWLNANKINNILNIDKIEPGFKFAISNLILLIREGTFMIFNNCELLKSNFHLPKICFI